MDQEKLKAEIKEIAEIAASVPEAFQARCFEILLQNLLGQSALPEAKSRRADADPGDEIREKPDQNADRGRGSLPVLPAQVKVFMQKTGVTADDIARVIMVEDGEAHFVREPVTQKIARGQIEWALLLALSNGITNNNLSVDPESVRSICQEKGFYDRTNFITNFKNAKNVVLFSGTMDSQGPAQKLTSEGQLELGRLVKALASAT
jgi:hypothetical protein